MELEIPRQWTEFVMWIGSPIVIGFVVSYLAERNGWFETLSPRVKQLVILVVSLALPAASYALQQLPADVLAEIEPLWDAIVYPGLVVFVGSQVAHWLRKRQGAAEDGTLPGEGVPKE